MLSRRRVITLGAIALIVIGFALIKPPTPAISIAAEEIITFGGYSVTNTILSAWVVIVLMAIPTLLLYRRLRNVEDALVPRGLQNLIEALLEAFFNIVALVAGERNGRRFFPVVATIFIFLLFANWFGLFPWNNVVGRTVDARTEYLEALEEDAEALLADRDADAQRAFVADVQGAFATVYLDPLPLAVDGRDEANARIASLLGGDAAAREAAVRTAFRADPLPLDLPAAELEEAVAARLRRAGLPAAELEEAIVFNLPLLPAEVDESELQAAVINSGGLNLIPLRADDFEFDPYLEQLLVPAGGGFAGARLYDSSEAADAENRPPAAGEIRAPVTVNTAHLGIVLKREAEGLGPDKGIGEIFPFFRSIATDLNLPLAIALWSLIFVQFWGIQSLGVRDNFGRFIGVGRAAVVKGPIGVMVGILEIISEVARIVSFTFRLFGNIFAGEILLFMAAFLVPFLVATVFYGLELFVGFIQAFVFAMLTVVFAVTAVAHGEQEHEAETDESAGP